MTDGQASGLRRLIYAGKVEGLTELAYGEAAPQQEAATVLFGSEVAFAVSAFRVSLFSSPAIFGSRPEDDFPRRRGDLRGKGLKRDLHIATHIGAGEGDTATADFTDDEHIDYGRHCHLILDVRADWQISVDVEAVHRPDVSGSGLVEGTPVYYDRARVGGCLAASIRSQGTTLSTSVAITERNCFDIAYSCQVTCTVHTFRRETRVKFTGRQLVLAYDPACAERHPRLIGQFDKVVEAGRSWRCGDGGRVTPQQAERAGLAFSINRVAWE